LEEAQGNRLAPGLRNLFRFSPSIEGESADSLISVPVRKRSEVTTVSRNRGEGSTREDIDKPIARVTKERRELDARPLKERINAVRERRDSQDFSGAAGAISFEQKDMSRPSRGRRSPRRDPAELQAEIREARLKWDAMPLEEKMKIGLWLERASRILRQR
jgi:hypothetical protein